MTHAVRQLPYRRHADVTEDWPLCVRDAELDTLLLAARRRNRPGAVLAGPAGAGRSRLAMAAVAAGGHDPSTCWVAGTAAGRQVQLGAFGPLLPDFTHAGAPDGARLRRVTAVLRARGTTLLAVDDAHLLDDASAALLHHLALRSGIAIVATLRSGAPAPDAVTALWKDHHLPRLELAPLDADRTRDLVEMVLDGQVEGHAATRLWEMTRGNLVLLRQVVVDEVEAGRLRLAAGVWLWSGGPGMSRRLADLLDAQIGTPPAEALRAAELVAAGGPLDLGVLEQLVGAAAIEDAEQCGLLTVDAPGTARLTLPLYGPLLASRSGAARRMRLRSMLATAGRPAQATGWTGRIEPRPTPQVEATPSEAAPSEAILSAAAGTDVKRGLLAAQLGQVRSAARSLRDAKAVLTLHGPTSDGVTAETASMALACALGMLGDAAGAADAARHPGAETSPQRLLAAGWAAAATGSVTEGAALAKRAAEAARADGDAATEATALHTAVRFGDPGVAPRLAELAIELRGPLFTAAAAHAAALAAHDGSALDAVSLELQRCGALLHAADAAAQAAVAHDHNDHRQAAVASAARAATLAQQCEGAQTPALRIAARPLPLTPREREVVTLAAAGMSNRDIAARLVVSVRTVEGHLYRAGSKLHVGTRTELVGVLGPA